MKPGEEISSAILELAHLLEVEQPDLNTCQQSWWESISTQIAHKCEDAKLDFQLDKRVDKKTFKRGRESAKWAAKLML